MTKNIQTTFAFACFITMASSGQAHVLKDENGKKFDHLHNKEAITLFKNTEAVRNENETEAVRNENEKKTTQSIKKNSD